MNEVKMSRLLRHPGLVNIYEAYEAEQYVHVTIEHFQGEELFTKIRAKDTLTEQEVASIMKELMATLSYLHSNHVIHRDIKPENVFLQYKEKAPAVKITNMDLAVKATGQLETLCCGSPGFIAPEVLNKEGYGVKADVFSCGVLLYCMYLGGMMVVGWQVWFLLLELRTARFWQATRDARLSTPKNCGKRSVLAPEVW